MPNPCLVPSQALSPLSFFAFSSYLTSSPSLFLSPHPLSLFNSSFSYSSVLLYSVTSSISVLPNTSMHPLSVVLPCKPQILFIECPWIPYTNLVWPRPKTSLTSLTASTSSLLSSSSKGLKKQASATSATPLVASIPVPPSASSAPSPGSAAPSSGYYSIATLHSLSGPFGDSLRMLNRVWRWGRERGENGI
jgi:hypothetical protein